MNQDDHVKKYLKITGIFVMLVLSYVAFSLATSYSRAIDPTSLRSFSVTGEGKVVAIPDVAQFTFSIITEGGVDIAKLQKENTDKANEAINLIKASGVEDKDLKTQGYNIEPRYQYYNCGIRPLYISGIDSTPTQEPCPPSEIVGYTIRQTVLVKVRDFSKTGDILSGIVKSGVNDISSLNFTIDNQKEIEKEARDKAIKEAREKAKDIAKAAKFGIGDIISINEGYSTPFVRFSEVSMMGGKDASASAPTIEPGSQEIIVNVTVQYEIR